MKTHVIVGAGQAGGHAAFSMREAGFRGRILLIGAEDELPYDRPPLSKSYLTAQDEPNPSFFFSQSAFDSAGIELLLGRTVAEVDPATSSLILSNGEKLGFDQLILAMGSTPRRLSVPGGETVRQFRTIADARSLRHSLIEGRRVVCIGAGVIGVEIAAAARQRGCSVTVVEIGSSIMARSLPRWIGEHIEGIHRRNGIEFRFGGSIAYVDNNSIGFADGTSLQADMLISGVGVQRNIDLAKRCGIATNTGILTDEFGQTNLANIYASGEIAEYYCWRTGRYTTQENWKHAEQHGRLVGRTVAGIKERYDQIPWFWSDQGALNIQVAGHALDKSDAVIRGDLASDSFSVFFLDDRDKVVGAVGLNKGRDVSAALRILQQGRRVDRALLSDVAVTPQRLVLASQP